ncbi:MAG: hypothetical protein GY715_13870 [Planctomycetes bacterium]|nr:hypothetical protein [Planctomycetota bacterium]
MTNTQARLLAFAVIVLAGCLTIALAADAVTGPGEDARTLGWMVLLIGAIGTAIEMWMSSKSRE